MTLLLAALLLQDLQSLVRDLRSDAIDVRTDASRLLTRMGTGALPSLRPLRNDADADVAARAREIADRIDRADRASRSWFPIGEGFRWTYRVADREATLSMEDAFDVELMDVEKVELGTYLRARRLSDWIGADWVAESDGAIVLGSRYSTQPGKGESVVRLIVRDRESWTYVDQHPGYGHCDRIQARRFEERVTVSAGTFDCVRIEFQGPADCIREDLPTLWLARGVGIVRLVRDGTVYELKSYRTQADE